MSHFRLSACLWVLLASLAAPVWAGTVVTKVEGAPMIVGSAGQRPAEVGTRVETGEAVHADAGCQVDIAMNDAVGCRLLSGTTCRIALDEGGMKIALEEGNVVLNLKKLPAATTFELETPLAVATVRGTQFWGRVPKAGDPAGTTFAVREGKIDLTLTGDQSTFSLEAGQALDVPEQGSGKLPEVRPALAEELQAIAQAADIATSV